jgi:hypothetical protein
MVSMADIYGLPPREMFNEDGGTLLCRLADIVAVIAYKNGKTPGQVLRVCLDTVPTDTEWQKIHDELRDYLGA